MTNTNRKDPLQLPDDFEEDANMSFNIKETVEGNEPQEKKEYVRPHTSDTSVGPPVETAPEEEVPEHDEHETSKDEE